MHITHWKRYPLVLVCPFVRQIQPWRTQRVRLSRQHPSTSWDQAPWLRCRSQTQTLIQTRSPMVDLCAATSPSQGQVEASRRSPASWTLWRTVTTRTTSDLRICPARRREHLGWTETVTTTITQTRTAPCHGGRRCHLCLPSPRLYHQVCWPLLG